MATTVTKRFPAVFALALGASLAIPSSPAEAATPRAGNQCRKRESGQVAASLRCTAVGGRFVWQRLPATAKDASSGCDPNYTPCVPIASDVDCAGGSGNGPAYVQGPVRVVGVDIYDLDRDGNGIGCEPR